MSGNTPPAVTAAQLANINAAMTAVTTYINHLQAAQQTAANNGNLTQVQNLTGPIQDAIALQQQLVFLHSIPNLTALSVAITTANQTTATINHQKAQIDGWVKAINTAATVLNDIASVVAAVAKI
jgi:bacterioferritin (cytochrome b1)